MHSIASAGMKLFFRQMKPSEKMKLFRAIESAGSRNGAQLENTAGAQRSNGGVKNTEKCR
jgi:hypothetical protein